MSGQIGARHFLLPGEWKVVNGPATISTLLGSCVSVCMYHRSLGHAGMNHFLLPYCEEHDAPGRYGDTAIPLMLRSLIRSDAFLQNYVAEIYGGASVLHATSGSGAQIGEKNIALARQLLDHHGIAIAKSDVGGTQARKLTFDTASRTVECVRLTKSSGAARPITRVLIVDDSLTARRVIRSLLEDAPHIEVVGEAKDAFEARSQILKLNPDLLTLDLEMPRLSGVAFLGKLKQHWPMPVVVISCRLGEPQVRAEIQRLGVNTMVLKRELSVRVGKDNARRHLTEQVERALAQQARHEDRTGLHGPPKSAAYRA